MRSVLGGIIHLKFAVFDYKTTIVFNSSDYRGSNYKDTLVSHKNEKYIDTPTISQVLKWLREKKSIHIEMSLGRNGWYFAIKQYKYYEKEGYYDCKLITVSVTWDSFGAAALDGIEYILDNLIMTQENKKTFINESLCENTL